MTEITQDDIDELLDNMEDLDDEIYKIIVEFKKEAEKE